jgi:hypothetical protein
MTYFFKQSLHGFDKKFEAIITSLSGFSVLAQLNAPCIFSGGIPFM